MVYLIIYFATVWLTLQLNQEGRMVNTESDTCPWTYICNNEWIKCFFWLTDSELRFQWDMTIEIVVYT